MNWLAPIGFLGLVGVVLLVVIYVIKPNYQTRRISSTYIWRMSLKYKKRRLPISRIRNLLTFLCQLLILTLLGILLARPVTELITGRDKNEAVILIDASAGMRLEDGESTRFERALTEAKKRAETAFDKGSRVSVILAGGKAEYLVTRTGADGRADALAALDNLYKSADKVCSFGTADILGAVSLAEAVLAENSAATVYLYTATDYLIDSGVKVENISSDGEWNAAILDCRAELDNDNHYKFTVDAACYSRTDFITVYCKIHGVNGDPNNTVTLEHGEFFDPSRERIEMVFTADLMPAPIYSYDYVEAYIELRDSFAEDNSFFLYGGIREVVKIQYASSSPNNFFESALRTVRQNNREVWDVQLSLLRDGEEYATEGFDIYIFEHKMPEVLPTDGVVILVDPTAAPTGSGLEIGSSYTVDSSSTLSAGTKHELTKYANPSRITIAKYTDVVLSEGYEELMLFNGRPVMLLRDTDDSRVLVWAFDLNYSNLIAIPEFSILMYNTFNYFITETLTGNSFEVGETVELNGRGDLLIEGGDTDLLIEGGEGEFIPTRPGTYTVTEYGKDGEAVGEESFFVRMPAAESEVMRTEELLPLAVPDGTRVSELRSLAVWFALALVAFMFIDWILEIRRNYLRG